MDNGYLVYSPFLPVSRHTALGHAALALVAALHAGETGFVVHEDTVVFTFTKPNPVVVNPVVVPVPSSETTTPIFPWYQGTICGGPSTTFCYSHGTFE